MFAKSRTINRQYIGKDIQQSMDVPNLIEIQTASYESFLQSERLKKGEPLLDQGLQAVFNSTFPIKGADDMSLEFDFYQLNWENQKFTELECKQKGLTYSVPLNARINLVFPEGKQILQKDIYMGDLPLMTDRHGRARRCPPPCPGSDGTGSAAPETGAPTPDTATGGGSG